MSLRARIFTLAQYEHRAKDIIFLASHFPVLIFSHVSRIVYKVAHSLTRRVTTSSALSIWMEDVTSDLFSVLEANLINPHQ